MTALAGVGCGSADGTNAGAGFFYPKGAALDVAGNLYVADSGNHTIRKISPGGVVTTLAGLAGNPGSADGAGNSARFNNPSGVAVDSAGNVYVADAGNHTIRLISPSGVVTTLVGFAGSKGASDGPNGNARFYHPMRVALDIATNLYVADTYNHTIRKIVFDARNNNWIVSTLAGLAGASGANDGSGGARFYYPWDLAVDGNGNVYVADSGNYTIRLVTPLGAVSTLAGLPGVYGIKDGTGSSARFVYPCALTVDSGDTVYVADSGGQTIRKIAPGGVVTTLTGHAGILGHWDGPATNALFNHPCGITVTGSGATLYVADSGNNLIRTVNSSSGATTTLEGLAAGSYGYVDNTNRAARFLSARATAVDGAGNVYVADTGNNSIRKITPAGVVTTLAGLAGAGGTNDGTGTNASFLRPTGLALDNATNLYVADSRNHTIRKITPAGAVSTLAGLAGVSGYADNTNTAAARFTNPAGVAVDAATNVYVTDLGNSVIRKITSGGAVSTLAGLALNVGSDDGAGTNARFTLPCAVAVDAVTNVYVADLFNHNIRVITPAGQVSTLAGLAGVPGSADGVGTNARFHSPVGLALDGAGNLYVADVANSVIRQITPAGVVTTVAGRAGSLGVADDNGPFAQFYHPCGLAVDGATNLYVADTFNSSIRKGTPYLLPIITTELQNQTALGGDTITFAVGAVGTGPLYYQWQKNGINISGATNATLFFKSTLVGDTATYAVVVSNAFGSVTNQPATLVVSVPPNDAFPNAIVLSGTNFTTTGSNVGATRAALEPNHAGTPGGRSVWWTWTAPADGGMTLDTHGSTFDTLLAVYTGNSLSTLASVVSNDDASTSDLTSSVSFGAKAGVTYHIAVDGYYGAEGAITLTMTWSPPVAPFVTLASVSQSDIAGSSVTFSAAATGSAPITYQWRVNTTNIIGATDTNLFLFQINSNNAGTYDIVASNPFGSYVSTGAVLTLTNGYTFTTLAGTSGSGSADGPGNVAQFHLPNNIAVDAATNLYVVDSLNATIRKITPAGVVSTLAGQTGNPGFAEGTGTNAQFSAPSGIALDAATNIYLADSANHVIRLVTPAGVVSTLAGTPGLAGNSDGTNTGAQFFYPSGVAVGPSNVIYVADSQNNAIRRIFPGGVVTTWAGTTGQNGYADGVGTNASFFYPEGLAFDLSSNLYVADTLNSTIRKIAPDGTVSTLAGMALDSGSLDGTNGNALFRNPEGLATDPSGNVFVTDTGNFTIRLINPAGAVTTIAGLAGLSGSTDGSNSAARFFDATGITLDSSGDIFIADGHNNTVRKISSGVTTTVAGTAGSGSLDGSGPNARFNYPSGAAADSAGNLYVADHLNHTIRKISSFGAVITWAGLAGISGTDDGTNGGARFTNPSGLAVDLSNNIYVADTGNNTIRKITPAGVVTTLAGTTAQFNAPRAVAADHAGNIYVADTGSSTIRFITPAGVVSTLAGVPGFPGTADGNSTNAYFWFPAGIAVDSATNVYVSDTGNDTIRKITPAGIVSTLAGVAGQAGISDGLGANARFTSPYGIAVDLSGNIYVADQNNNTIRYVTPAGLVRTLGGLARAPGNADGVGAAVNFSGPLALAVDGSGNVFVADAGNYSVRLGRNGALFGPALKITFVPNYAVISWPSSATNYLLESSSVPISTAVWTPLTIPLPVIVGSNFVVSNLLSPTGIFYRLHK